jgi:hypothetical protein
MKGDDNMYIYFKHMNLRTPASRNDEFANELEKLLIKYAGTDWTYQYTTEDEEGEYDDEEESSSEI